MTTEHDPIEEEDTEFDAMRTVYTALKKLDTAAQNRVLDYVFRRLGLKDADRRLEPEGSGFSPRDLAAEVKDDQSALQDEGDSATDDELAGVSPVALKWIRRNALKPSQLSTLFSLGLDDIELVATSVPGENKKEKMRNILLLTGAAGYLGTGAARTDDDKAREALGHYNAYDGKNFAAYLKDMAAEVSGTKASGYTLTARGLAGAAELVKTMTSSA